MGIAFGVHKCSWFQSVYYKALIAAFMLLTSVVYAADRNSAFHLNEEYESAYNFSIAVRAGDMLYIGGITSVDEEGNEVFAENPRKQMELIYERFDKILKAHGASFKSVVSETIYYNIDSETYVSLLDIRAKRYKGMAGPSASGVRVADFASNNILIEIKAVAYLRD